MTPVSRSINRVHAYNPVESMCVYLHPHNSYIRRGIKNMLSLDALVLYLLGYSRVREVLLLSI